ncbi:MAG: preprotein translocase subunit SecG [Alphaproteobacteria bacterium]|jgi:preprotein translocase subunit SecG|nr:preprotein translocase subunit SecG [Alphaproteobacteria bacterium]
METIILVIHLLIGLALVGVVLMQRSEGGLGGLGGGGGGGGGASGGMGGLLGNRTTANLLTRATAVLAALFMTTSISLAILAGSTSGGGSIVNETPGTPHSDTMTPVPTLPATPSVPTSE